MRLYRIALRFYPKGFRDLFADELIEIQCSRIREAADARERGRLWLGAFASTLRHGLAERRAERIRRRGRDRSTRVRGTAPPPGRWLGTPTELSREVRRAARSLARRPIATGAMVLTLALGLGANLFLFGIVDAVLLRGPAYPEADRLVLIANRYGSDVTSSSAPDFFDRRDLSTTLRTVAAWRMADVTAIPLAREGPGDPLRLRAARVTGRFFEVLGVEPALGRVDFPAAEETSSDTVVLSDRSWRRTFGGDPAVVGRRVVLDGVAHTVAAVMPAAVDHPHLADLWLPLTFTPDELAVDARPYEFLRTIARVADGVALGEVTREMELLASRSVELQGQRAEFLRRNDFGASVVTLRESNVGDVDAALLMLSCGVGVLLLLACSNVAHILLAQGAARRLEMAVRHALGAGRVALARLLLIESVLIAGAGGVLGLGLAALGLAHLDLLVPHEVPGLDRASVDPRLVGFAALVSLVAAMLFGLPPALRATAPGDLRAGRGTLGEAGGRRALVVGEVAMALLLLVGAGILTRSFASLTRVDPGFASDGRLALRLSLPPDWTPERTLAFQDELVATARALPGTQSAALADHLPLTGQTWTATFRPVGAPPDTAPGADIDVVGAGFFDALDIPLLAGRTFGPSDVPDSARVVIVDEVAARRHFVGIDEPLANALGRLVDVGDPGEPRLREIVGVVGHVHMGSLAEEGSPQLYFAASQIPLSTFDLVVETSLANPMASAGALGERIRDLEPGLPTGDIRSYESWVGRSVALERFQVRLLSGMASGALVLASLGLYGVLAFSVTRRRRELGLRVALGASSSDLVLGVVREGLALTALGSVLGSLAALPLIRLLERLPWETQPADPVAWAVAVAVLLVVGALAASGPARRAVRIDPARALLGD